MYCWDKDKRTKAMQNNKACSQEELWRMSLDELRYKLSYEWMNSGKTEFAVYKKSILDLGSKKSIEWVAAKGSITQKISVQFV